MTSLQEQVRDCANQSVIGSPWATSPGFFESLVEVEAQFTHLGSTGSEARPASGELRRQFGLKLLAQDTCNLVYAVWRMKPQSKLVVSVEASRPAHQRCMWQ